jgi:hypothetical protein
MSDWGIDFTEEDTVVKVPTGIHKLIIDSAEIIKTKSGGSGALIKFQVATPGEFKGAFVSDFFNLRNSNPQAVSIGKRSLDSFAKALGLSGLTAFNKTPLHSLTNKTVNANLKSVTDDYGTKAAVKKYVTDDYSTKAMVKKSVTTPIPYTSSIDDDEVPF